MDIVADYTLTRKDDKDEKTFFVVNTGSVPPCPRCGGALYCRDSRKRICRLEGGKIIYLVIRRLRCEKCCFLHNELPDCVAPHKHYAAKIISGVLDETVSPEDEAFEDYPCLETMRRWVRWFLDNRNDMVICAESRMSFWIWVRLPFFPPLLCSTRSDVDTKTGLGEYFASSTTAADLWRHFVGESCT